MKIVDSHCHIDDEKFDQDREKVISNFEDDGIDFIVDPASDISSSEKIIEIVKKYDRVYGAVGIHPHEVEDVTDEDLKKVYEMSFSEKIVAIGEIDLIITMIILQEKNKKKSLENNLKSLRKEIYQL